jgi:hypothetical protein
VTPPDPNKWLKRKDEILPAMEGLEETIERLDRT